MNFNVKSLSSKSLPMTDIKTNVPNFVLVASASTVLDRPQLYKRDSFTHSSESRLRLPPFVDRSTQISPSIGSSLEKVHQNTHNKLYKPNEDHDNLPNFNNNKNKSILSGKKYSGRHLTNYLNDNYNNEIGLNANADYNFNQNKSSLFLDQISSNQNEIFSQHSDGVFDNYSDLSNDIGNFSNENIYSKKKVIRNKIQKLSGLRYKTNLGQEPKFIENEICVPFKSPLQEKYSLAKDLIVTKIEKNDHDYIKKIQKHTKKENFDFNVQNYKLVNIDKKVENVQEEKFVIDNFSKERNIDQIRKIKSRKNSIVIHVKHSYKNDDKTIENIKNIQKKSNYKLGSKINDAFQPLDSLNKYRVCRPISANLSTTNEESVLELNDSSGNSFSTIDGNILKLSGSKSLEAFDRTWPVHSAGVVTQVTFDFIDFIEIARVFHKIRIRFPNCVHLVFQNTNLCSLHQLNALAACKKVESLNIEEPGNPIIGLNTWKLYALFRLAHLGLKRINENEITMTDISKAEIYFGQLSNIISTSIPRATMQFLLGDKKKSLLNDIEKSQNVKQPTNSTDFKVLSSSPSTLSLETVDRALLVYQDVSSRKIEQSKLSTAKVFLQSQLIDGYRISQNKSILQNNLMPILRPFVFKCILEMWNISGFFKEKMMEFDEKK